MLKSQPLNFVPSVAQRLTVPMKDERPILLLLARTLIPAILPAPDSG